MNEAIKHKKDKVEVKKTMEFDKHTAETRSSVYFEKCKVVVSGGYDNDIIIWNAKTGKKLKKSQYDFTNTIRHIHRWDDCHFLVSSDDGKKGVKCISVKEPFEVFKTFLIPDVDQTYKIHKLDDEYFLVCVYDSNRSEYYDTCIINFNTSKIRKSVASNTGFDTIILKSSVYKDCLYISGDNSKNNSKELDKHCAKLVNWKDNKILKIFGMGDTIQNYFIRMMDVFKNKQNEEILILGSWNKPHLHFYRTRDCTLKKDVLIGSFEQPVVPVASVNINDDYVAVGYNRGDSTLFKIVDDSLKKVCSIDVTGSYYCWDVEIHSIDVFNNSASLLYSGGLKPSIWKFDGLSLVNRNYNDIQAKNDLTERTEFLIFQNEEYLFGKEEFLFQVKILNTEIQKIQKLFFL